MHWNVECTMIGPNLADRKPRGLEAGNSDQIAALYSTEQIAYDRAMLYVTG